MSDKCTQERFLGDIKDHEITILRDDGADRHIRLKKPGTSCYFFDLITWPGHLCISGDCGTFVFQRTHDMFDFFRTDRKGFDFSADAKLYINPPYWAEKVQAESRFGGGAEAFSEDLFRGAIKKHFDNHFEEEIERERQAHADAVDGDPLHPDEVRDFEAAAAKRAELWQEIEDEVLYYVDDEHQACRAAYEFESDGFQFQDFFEHRLKDYTFHFIWNCYAIAWGIAKYDAAKIAAQTEIQPHHQEQAA